MHRAMAGTLLSLGGSFKPMRTPKGISTGRLLQILAVLVLAAIVVNPELRVLLFFLDAVGLELVILLFALQARVIIASLAPAIHGLAMALCELASGLGRSALAAYPGRVYSCRLHRVLCPILIVLSFGLRCHATPQAA